MQVAQLELQRRAWLHGTFVSGQKLDPPQLDKDVAAPSADP